MGMRNAATGIVALAAVFSACAENSTEPSKAGRVSVVIVGGNSQVGITGQELPVPLKARVTDDKGRPRAGVLVNFRVTKGGGRLYAGSSLSDNAGHVQDYWTLGSELFTTQQVDVVAVDQNTGTKLNYGSFTAKAASSLSAQLVVTPTTADLGSAAVNASGSSATFTVTNTGAATSGAITTTLGGANGGNFQLGAGTCSGTTLEMGATCQVTVQLAPVTVGSLTATLSVSASPGGTATAALQGTSIGVPVLAIAPATHAFGSATVGTSSANQVFTVSNSGSAASGPLSVSFTGPNPSQFQVVSSTCTGALAAGASCTVTAKYQPTAPGSHSASLEVTGAPGGTVSAMLTGSAVTPALLQITPNSASFGAVVPPSTIITLSFTITNTGGSPSGILVPQITGGSGSFSIGTSTCTAALAVAASCSVSVRFQPRDYGGFTGALSVTAAPGGTVQSTLTGYGVYAPQLNFSPPSVNFGSVATGQVSGDQQITVAVITGPAGPVALSIVGSNPSDFTITGGTCLTAGLSGGSCSVLVRFAPTAVGPRSASLQVVSSAAGGGSGLVPLTGNGGTPALSVNPSIVNFGAGPVGSASPYVGINVLSNGNAPAGPLAVSIVGTNPGDFEIGTNSCTGATLSPGQQCVVAVRFAPTTTGARTATLQVSGGGVTVTADLSGAGL